MESRYLSALNLAISTADDPLKQGCLRAEKASYLARRGSSDLAAHEIASLRLDKSYLASPELSSWINFAEGMSLHCVGRDRDAAEKWSRSRAISEAMGVDEISTLASAWLALLDYTRADLVSMNDNFKRCLHKSSALSHQASARLCLTIAQCFHVCGDISEARKFYSHSRLECLMYGDDVMLSALIHNMAWIRVTNNRNGLLRDKGPIDTRELIDLGAETTAAYEQLVGISSFSAMTPLLQAQVHLLNGEMSVADRAITENIIHLGNQGLSRMRPGLLADRAFCRATMGNFAAASQDIKEALSSIDGTSHVDDLAVAHCRISSAYQKIGQIEASKSH